MFMKTAFVTPLLFLTLAPATLGQQLVAAGPGIRNPALAVAATGDFIAVWNDGDDGTGSFGVFARLYDESGKPKGPVFPVHEDRFGDQLWPQVAADERGNFVVVWQGPDGDGVGVFAQRFDRTGRRLGHAIRTSRSAAGFQISPDVAMNADGSFLVVWNDCPRHDRCPSLRVGRFSAGGKRRGQELEIPVPAGGGSNPPRAQIAIEPEGFAVGWTERTIGHQCVNSDVRVRHFTTSGRPAGEPFHLDDTGNCDTPGWSLAALVTDRAGSSAAFFNGLRNSFQLFEPDGNLAGPRRVIGRRSCHGLQCEHISAVAMASDGHFAVIWNRQQAASDPEVSVRYSLLVQFFDAAGRPLGERFEVASSSEFIYESAAAFDENRTLVLIWNDQISDGAGSSPFRMLFRQIRAD